MTNEMTMTATAVQPPYEHFFRKVDMNGTFKKTWKILGLYFTISNCRVKKRHACGYSRENYEGKRLYKIKKRQYEQSGGCCPHCGRPVTFDEAELHHVLPYARFQDLIGEERNTVLLCHDCHKEIHCNPWRNIQLMQQKADELGINLDERYNREDVV